MGNQVLINSRIKGTEKIAFMGRRGWPKSIDETVTEKSTKTNRSIWRRAQALSLEAVPSTCSRR